MKKLEYISAYLPYKVRTVIYHNTRPNYTDYETNGVLIGYNWMGQWIHRNDITQNIETCNWGWIKLILRPLSDLENNIDELFIEMGGGFKTTKHFKQHFINNILYSPYESLSYKTVIFLLKNHFDVFGLIEKGLAININTLK